MRNKKRGYFFVLDAMLGMLVLVVGVFIIASSYTKVPQQAQVGFLSDDLLDFLSNTKIQDLNNPYAGIGGDLWNQGKITEAQNSLLQQIGEFYDKGDFATAEEFIKRVSQGIVPQQFRYEILFEGNVIYPKTMTAAELEAHTKSKENTKLMLTSKKVTFGIKDKALGDLWGPYKAEVFVWEK